MSVAFGIAQGGGCVVISAIPKPEEHFESRVGQTVACSVGSSSCASWKAKKTKFCSAAFFPSASEETKSLLPFSWTVFMMHLPCQDFLESLIRKGHIGSLIL